jgi:hypothetical protein
MFENRWSTTYRSMTAFWYIPPCSLEVDRRFGGAYCLHHQIPESYPCLSSWEPELSYRRYMCTGFIHFDWFDRGDVISDVKKCILLVIQSHRKVKTFQCLSQWWLHLRKRCTEQQKITDTPKPLRGPHLWARKEGLPRYLSYPVPGV